MKKLTSRLYENQHDFEQMQDLLMEARSLTNDWRYSHVGELAFNYFMVAIHLNPQKHIRLWHDNGKLVGYAILGEDPAFDWQVFVVHPKTWTEELNKVNCRRRSANAYETEFQCRIQGQGGAGGSQWSQERSRALSRT